MIDKQTMHQYYQYTKDMFISEIQGRISKLDDEPLRETLSLAQEIIKICQAHHSECATCSAFLVCAVADMTMEQIWFEMEHRLNERERQRLADDWNK